MNSKILIMMTGSIAAYKACSVLSALKQKQFEIEVILTPSCLKFVGAATIEGLTGRSPIVDMYEPGRVMDHIHLQRWADLILVVPATAHFINRLAVGIGDDLATTLFLAHDFKKPFLLAPAMNTKMYLHPTTQKALRVLMQMGVDVLESASGVLACGETGWGRLLEPNDIVKEVENSLKSLRHKTVPRRGHFPRQNESKVLRKKVLITAGGTTEPIDSVRTLTNTSTGQTGFTIAKTLAELGYDVHLLMSESHSVRQLWLANDELQVEYFSTFQNLSHLMKSKLKENDFDVIIHAAAVSDFSMKNKLSKQKLDSTKDLVLRLKKNPKLIHAVKKWSRNKNTQLIGFKLTSSATEKDINNKVAGIFKTARADFVIHNDTSEIRRNGSDTHHSFRWYSPDLKFQKLNDTAELLLVLSQQLNQEVKK
jgi:phosphopantothenoylcysteine decarboxylase/phosphopantothenate--cysteine ligase